MNRKMHALFREADVTDRDDRLYVTGLLLNRKLDTSKGLTVADGKAVIDALENLKAAGHDEGLVGAVNDLIRIAELRESEQDDAAQDAADDDTRSES
jgi:phospholipase/lecithinase/hemolysin